MKCNNCGNECDDNAKFCNICGAPLVHTTNSSSKYYLLFGILSLLVIVSIMSYMIYQECSTDSKNPVLMSENDITDALLRRIANNRLTSLTINYEFASCPTVLAERAFTCPPGLSDQALAICLADNEREHEDITTHDFFLNPFRRANRIRRIFSIDFEIKLGDNVKSLDCAFYNLSHMDYVNLKDTSHITSMKGMFAYSDIQQLLEHWNTANVTDMSAMFLGAGRFNQPLSNWNTSNVTNMSRMFERATAFNQPIGSWNTANVTDMSGMFAETKFFNQPIGNWNTVNVTRMFSHAHKFNQPIDNWNIANVMDMAYMFADAYAFNQMEHFSCVSYVWSI